MSDVTTRLRNAPNGVTIAIPNWNHEYLLARSIGSSLRAIRVLREHGVRGEVLVTDDSSRDGSVPLLRQFEALYYDDGLRIRLNVGNRGLTAIRNEQLSAATYRYICFLDADDELIPENMWHFYRAIRQTDATLVYGNMLGLSEDPEENIMLSNESFQRRMLAGNYIGALVLGDRLKLVDNGGFPNNITMIGREDWELNLHTAALGQKLIFVPLMMGIYYHTIPNSQNKDARQNEIHHKQNAYIRRVFNQLGLRPVQPLNTRHLRYHPDVGYL